MRKKNSPVDKMQDRCPCFLLRFFQFLVNRPGGTNRPCFPLAAIINVFARRCYASLRDISSDLEYARLRVEPNKKLHKFLCTNAVSGCTTDQLMEHTAGNDNQKGFLIQKAPSQPRGLSDSRFLRKIIEIVKAYSFDLS